MTGDTQVHQSAPSQCDCCGCGSGSSSDDATLRRPCQNVSPLQFTLSAGETERDVHKELVLFPAAAAIPVLCRSVPRHAGTRRRPSDPQSYSHSTSAKAAPARAQALIACTAWQMCDVLDEGKLPLLIRWT